MGHIRSPKSAKLLSALFTVLVNDTSIGASVEVPLACTRPLVTVHIRSDREVRRECGLEA